MVGKCGICGRKGYVVRDHNHRTGFIRGMLCDPCNGRLGKYEADLRRGTTCQGERYLTWLSRYGDNIVAHLKKNTGVQYVPFRRFGRDKRAKRRKDETGIESPLMLKWDPNTVRECERIRAAMRDVARDAESLDPWRKVLRDQEKYARRMDRKHGPRNAPRKRR